MDYYVIESGMCTYDGNLHISWRSCCWYLYYEHVFAESCVNAISQLFCLNGFVINYYQAPRLLIEQLVLIFFTLGIDLLLPANVYV